MVATYLTILLTARHKVSLVFLSWCLYLSDMWPSDGHATCPWAGIFLVKSQVGWHTSSLLFPRSLFVRRGKTPIGGTILRQAACERERASDFTLYFDYAVKTSSLSLPSRHGKKCKIPLRGAFCFMATIKSALSEYVHVDEVWKRNPQAKKWASTKQCYNEVFMFTVQR